LIQFTSVLYALDIAGLLFVLFVLYRLAIKSAKASSREIANYYLPTSDGLILSAILFAVSILPIFWTTRLFGLQLRFDLWIAALLFGQVSRKISRYVRDIKI